MKIFISADDNTLVKACEDIGRLFFPAAKYTAEDPDMKVSVDIESKGELIAAQVTLKGNGFAVAKTVEDKQIEGTEDYNQARRVSRLAFLRALEELTGKNAGPWGILTGIRPTKIVHRLTDAGWQDENIRNHLVQGYALESDKASLLMEIARLEQPYMLSREQAGELVSIYLGIPFCPSRCSYCSFPAYGMDQAGHLVGAFLDALRREIKATGEYIRNRKLKVQTIYMGGGTPTSLDDSQLAQLLDWINTELRSEATVEFTVEAGRPDTLTPQKLQIIKAAGATRISINPQSMHAETLAAIGRHHRPWDVADAVEKARETGLNNINMDLIVGLPGETMDHIRETMRYVGMMAPENITLHTLAVKRASEIKGNPDNYDLPDGETVEGMFDVAMHTARMMGMQPYYMYRQKRMVGPLENVGFALQGFECIYNIQMIEERQTIIGLGAGAGSKLVNTADWTLENMYNPKDPETYIERIEELIARKIEGMNKVFTG